MFKLLKAFFIIFGIIHFLLWSGLGYAWMTDIYGLRTTGLAVIRIIYPWSETNQTTDIKSENTTKHDATELPSIKNNLVNLTALNDTQLNCLQEKISPTRVEAITAGAKPTPLEIIAGVSCL